MRKDLQVRQTDPEIDQTLGRSIDGDYGGGGRRTRTRETKARDCSQKGGRPPRIGKVGGVGGGFPQEGDPSRLKGGVRKEKNTLEKRGETTPENTKTPQGEGNSRHDRFRYAKG